MKRMLVAAGLMLAACSSVSASADPAPPPLTDDPDACHASQYQSFVGRKLNDLPAKPDGAVWRQACTQCPVTMDFNPRRMNAFFDKDTEVIKTIKCG